jgi:hypothetical protein
VVSVIVNRMSSFTVVRHNACDATASQRRRTS